MYRKRCHCLQECLFTTDVKLSTFIRVTLPRLREELEENANLCGGDGAASLGEDGGTGVEAGSNDMMLTCEDELLPRRT